MRRYKRHRCNSDVDSLFSISSRHPMEFGGRPNSDLVKNHPCCVVNSSRFSTIINWPYDADYGGTEGSQIIDVFKI